MIPRTLIIKNRHLVSKSVFFDIGNTIVYDTDIRIIKTISMIKTSFKIKKLKYTEKNFYKKKYF